MHIHSISWPGHPTPPSITSRTLVLTSASTWRVRRSPSVTPSDADTSSAWVARARCRAAGSAAPAISSFLSSTALAAAARRCCSAAARKACWMRSYSALCRVSTAATAWRSSSLQRSGRRRVLRCCNSSWCAAGGCKSVAPATPPTAICAVISPIHLSSSSNSSSRSRVSARILASFS